MAEKQPPKQSPPTSPKPASPPPRQPIPLREQQKSMPRVPPTPVKK